VYIYEGKNILDPTTPLAEKASMVVRAKGKSGACVDYVRRTFEGLSSIDLDDSGVTGLWEAVRNHPGPQRAFMMRPTALSPNSTS